MSAAKKSTKASSNYNSRQDATRSTKDNLIGKTLSSIYTFKSKIGVGTFGTVYKCFDAESKNHVAVKVIESKEAAAIELYMLKKLRRFSEQNKCSYLIEILDCFSHKPPHKDLTCLVFPLHGPSISQALKQNETPFEMEEVRTIARQLIEATKFLHDNRMLHSDIKTGNILLNKHYYNKNYPANYKSPNIVLCDFGSAYLHDDFDVHEVTTLPYRAPEVLMGMKTGYHCDIWSIGCVAFELYKGKRLFDVGKEEELFILVHNTVGPFSKSQLDRAMSPENKHKIELTLHKSELDDVIDKLVDRISTINKQLEEIERYEKNFYDLLKQMLVIDLDKRISLRKALNLTFFTELKEAET